MPRFLAQFHSAIRETFTTLHYPTRDRLAKVDFLMEFRDNRYNVRNKFGKPWRASRIHHGYRPVTRSARKVETRLFTQQSMPWTEIKRRAATSPVWQWHRPDALDRLKADCLHKDIWREEGSYINKGPFPKPATTVRIQELTETTRRAWRSCALRRSTPIRYTRKSEARQHRVNENRWS